MYILPVLAFFVGAGATWAVQRWWMWHTDPFRKWARQAEVRR